MKCWILVLVATMIAATGFGEAVTSHDTRPQGDSFPPPAKTPRTGVRFQVPYVPEAKQEFTPEQFGLNKYYAPTFAFSLDWNPGGKTIAYRKTLGVNRFNCLSISEKEKPNVTFGDAMAYVTEGGMHGPLEGAGYFESTLAQYEQYIWDHMPAWGYGNDAGVKLAIFDIETSIAWHRNAYQGNSHWPTWESVKNHSVLCESDGKTRTLEQIDRQGLWEVETEVRRANRVKLAFRIIKAKSRPGVKVSYGASLYQGLPRLDFNSCQGIFLEGNADVSHLGGLKGTIVLNGRTYTGMTGSQWADEDVMWGYYYLFNFTLRTAQDYQDIWIKKIPSTQNYPYLWSRMDTWHIVADEKGYLQQNRRLMQARLGAKHSIVRMMEPIYEGDFSGGVPGLGLPIARIPFAELAPAKTGNGEYPKIWQPPYMNYSRYCVTRFFAGDEPNWGFHVFPTNDALVSCDLDKTPFYNQHLHSLTALFQARADMQPYEDFYPGSTLVEDPEVQENQTGPFSNYDGTAAYNYNGGKQGEPRPAYMLRYKPIAQGWQVVILGGQNQDWTTERTDIVRVPGGRLNGNQFRVKLRGPSAHVYAFRVQSGDAHQTYNATSTVDPAWEKPGYAGRTRAN